MPLRTSPNQDKPVTVPLTLRKGGQTQTIGKAIVSNYQVVSTRLYDSVDDDVREFVNSNSCPKETLVQKKHLLTTTIVSTLLG